MVGFFEHQDRARRKTRFLVVLMALGVLAMGCAFFAVFSFIERTTGYSLSNAATPDARRREVLLWCVLGTAVVVLAASSLRMLTLRGGGASIAEMLGGRLVSGSPRDVLERRLVNVVEEMAIASGVPVPQVFVLDAERGINAFAAGDALEDAAIAVTRGGLEKLTREELQGVVAHEFSHVLNGDMRLNIRMMGIVFGILCIGLLGRLLMRMGIGSGSRSFLSGGRRRGGPGAVFVLLGLAVFVIGTIGEFLGNLIKAAVSRQREFLADASAVQFTRNPSGIAGALKKIGGFSAGAEVTGAHAEEASHFFFGDIHKRLFAHSVLATHPPLAERITRIDPGFRGQFPEVPEGIAQPEEVPVLGLAPGVAPSHAQPETIDPRRVVQQLGAMPADASQLGRGLIDALPHVLREASESPFSAVAIVYAMLLAEDAAVQEAQLGFAGQLSSPRLAQEALRLRDAVRGLSRRDRLSLAELLAPALRQLNEQQRTSFVHTVQALVRTDAKISIFEYVLTELLKERFGAAPGRTRGAAHHRSLKPVRAELELLLSLLAHAGALRSSDAASAFAAGANRLGAVTLGLLEHSERLLSALGPALAALRVLSPQRCAEVVDACAHVVLADRRVTEDEATLLRAVSSALGCPLPPLNLPA